MLKQSVATTVAVAVAVAGSLQLKPKKAKERGEVKQMKTALI